ncbi:MAG: hypothetical protein K2J31_02500 [Alistipes sp.]|nr:hypothetical protein [Alistipes sp.]
MKKLLLCLAVFSLTLAVTSCNSKAKREKEIKEKAENFVRRGFNAGVAGDYDKVESSLNEADEYYETLSSEEKNLYDKYVEEATEKLMEEAFEKLEDKYL